MAKDVLTCLLGCFQVNWFCKISVCQTQLSLWGTPKANPCQSEKGVFFFPLQIYLKPNRLIVFLLDNDRSFLHLLGMLQDKRMEIDKHNLNIGDYNRVVGKGPGSRPQISKESSMERSPYFDKVGCLFILPFG